MKFWNQIFLLNVSIKLEYIKGYDTDQFIKGIKLYK